MKTEKKYNFSENAILFRTEEEYIEFIRHLATTLCNFSIDRDMKDTSLTHLRCLEDIEEFFGVWFGTQEDYEKYQNCEDFDDANLDNVIVTDRQLFPVRYPCLFLVHTLNCFSGEGSAVLKFSDYPDFIYLEDFKLASYDQDFVS